MYGYIYLTTNNINGKIYVGQHKSKKFDTGYYGSGKRFVNALNKYGKENFSVDVLEWCDTSEDLDKQEMYWIDKLNSTNRDIGYNITKGGEGWKGGKHTQETKAKISKSKTGKSPNRIYSTPSEEVRQKISAGLKEYYKTHDGTRKNVSPSAETRQKLREANLGKKYPEEVRAKHCGRVAPNKGTHLTEEQREHLRKINTGKKYSEATKEKHRQHWLGKNNPNYGGLSESAKKKLSEAFKGRIWVTNGTVRKQIHPEQLDYYISQGYHRGRKLS